MHESKECFFEYNLIFTNKSFGLSHARNRETEERTHQKFNYVLNEILLFHPQKNKTKSLLMNMKLKIFLKVFISVV